MEMKLSKPTNFVFSFMKYNKSSLALEKTKNDMKRYTGNPMYRAYTGDYYIKCFDGRKIYLMPMSKYIVHKDLYDSESENNYIKSLEKDDNNGTR
jgi:hypothetical protein